jgi:hypothetical protein
VGLLSVTLSPVSVDSVVMTVSLTTAVVVVVVVVVDVVVVVEVVVVVFDWVANAIVALQIAREMLFSISPPAPRFIRHPCVSFGTGHT